jgi:hypothetical protein
MNGIRVFISSKISEFEIERAILADKIRSIPYLEPVMSEEWHPQRSSIRDTFVDQVNDCQVYIGLFGCIYSEPTEVEYRTAILNEYREIVIYIRQCNIEQREPLLQQLVAELKQNHVTSEYRTAADLVTRINDHLKSMIVQMIRRLLRLGELAVGADTRGLSTRGRRELALLQSLGLPSNKDLALELATRLNEVILSEWKR